MGANIIQNVTIGDRAIIGAGANIYSDVESDAIVYGWRDREKKPLKFVTRISYLNAVMEALNSQIDQLLITEGATVFEALKQLDGTSKRCLLVVDASRQVVAGDFV